MKRILIISALALVSTAAHAGNTLTVTDLLNAAKSGDQWVNGYVAGISESDPKVCTGTVTFGTQAAQVVASIQADIESAPTPEKAKQFRDFGAIGAVGATLENLYPCK